MPKTTARCYTTYRENVLAEDEASILYDYLRETIQWEEGVRSKHGFTRKAKPLEIGDEPLVDEALTLAISALAKYDYVIDGIYLNYYENGNMWTPNHNHPGTHQIVLSLGAERVLTVAGKEYMMKNGSGIIFGSATHGVPKCAINDCRISIATFMTPVI